MDKGKARAVQHASASPLSYNQLLDALCQFLEVAIHTILCLRGVYPADVFTKRKKYDHPCYQSRHPGLNEYVARVVKSTKEEIQQSKVDKVVLVLRPVASLDSVAYERYVFALGYVIPSSSIDLRNRDLAISSNVSRQEIDLIFRGFLQKLMVIDGVLYNLPAGDQEELTFAVVLEMKDDYTPSGKGKDQPLEGDWIPADTDNAEETALRPIKTLDSGVINMMLYVQEDLGAKSAQTSSGRPRGRLIDKLLEAKASQAVDPRGAKNRAKRLDGERELDQPPTSGAEAAGKRKRARMVLGGTRAADSASESSESEESSVDIRDNASDVEM